MTQGEFSNEYRGTDAPATNLPEGAEATAPMKRELKTYTMKDGSQGSRAAYIKELFVEDKLSRTEIAEKHGFSYRDVYSATVNMVNGTESGARGRTPTSTVIKVNAERKLATANEEGIYTLVETGEVVDVSSLTDVNRNDWIKEQVEAGTERGTIAKQLELSYGVVYGVTKEMEGAKVRQEYDITKEDGTVEKVSRAAYIRHLYNGGMSRSDIMKELGVAYQVVWQATKEEKEEPTLAEKFEGLIADLSSFGDKIEDKHAKNFDKVIEALKAITLKPEEVAAEAAGAEGEQA